MTSRGRDAGPAVSSYPLDTGPPRFHGASRIGCRPGTELVHTVAATGERPLRFAAGGLPASLTLDPGTGIVRGIAPIETGTVVVEVTAENGAGTTTTTVELCVGDRLALTPPMGWNSWNVYGSDVDAGVVRRVADGMVDSGMRDLGYQYVNIDDHWHAAERGPDGEPVADPTKFPDGIGAVADYVHERGLKLGIYSDAAEKTCGGCFGGLDHEEIDARAYADWGVDLLKYDYCHAPVSRQAAEERYATMADALADCGRSIVFSVCEWGLRRPWEWAPGLGASLWRTTPDIFDTFSWGWIGVRGIARTNLRLAEHAGPGQWNDPDMLLIGNRGQGGVTSRVPLVPNNPDAFERLKLPLRGLDDAQALSHMTLWAMMAAPLLTSDDPFTRSDFDRDLLCNPDVLAVNQDRLGMQARVIAKRGGVWVLRKPLADGAQAVSLTNVRRRRRSRALALASIGAHRSEVTDLWTGEALGRLDRIEVDLPRHASRLFRVEPTTGG